MSAALMIAGTWALITFVGTRPQSKSPRVLSVQVERVNSSSSYRIAREYVGQVEARQSSMLSFELGGKVIELTVEEGDTVVAGQPLARLDTLRLQVERDAIEARQDRVQATLQELQEGPRDETIAAARAELKRVQADYELAALNAQRDKQLLPQDAISRERWDRSRLTRDALKQQVAAAKARLDELLEGTRQEQIAAQAARLRQTDAELRGVEVDLRKSVLRAPYDGVIAERSADRGEVIQAGSPIVELVEMPRLRARIGLAGQAAAALQVGDQRTLRIGTQNVTGDVIAIRPDRQPATRSVTVLFALRHPSREIKVGDVATCVIEREVSQAGYWLPLSALTEGERGLWACYVVQALDELDNRGRGKAAVNASQAEVSDATNDSSSPATHRLDRRPLELLYQTADRAYVIGPLEAGERVVRDGVHRIVPQQQVRLAAENEGGM